MASPSTQSLAEKIPVISQKSNSDPYLVWAKATEFREYEKNKYCQIAAVAGSDNPFKIPETDGEWPHCGLRLIAKLSDKQSLYTGMIKKDDLVKYEQKCALLELNIPRYDDAGLSGGGIDDMASPELGKNVMAVIDFGCAFAHQQFWDAWGGTTRVRYFWDQDSKRTVRLGADKDEERNRYWFPNTIFRYGRETTSAELKDLLLRCMRDGTVDEDLAYDLADYPELQAASSHGAHVMDLAAGRINPMSGLEDEASTSDIIFVQLPRDTVSDTSGGSMTMYVLDALYYIIHKTRDVEHLVINMSFGSTAGPHDGTSLLERGIDALIRSARTDRAGKGTIELVLPAGNHFLADLHGAVELSNDTPSKKFYWQIIPDDYTENYLEIWSPANTNLSIEVASPSGVTHKLESDKYHYLESKNNALALIRSTASACGDGELILIALAPTQSSKAITVEPGIWTISVSCEDVTDTIVVNAWIERDDPMPWQNRQQQSRLLCSAVEREINSLDSSDNFVKRAETGNSLAYGQVPIVVGGYVVRTNSNDVNSEVLISAFSAAAKFEFERGYLAPSDETEALDGILAASNRSGILARMNGTSVAAPQVARQLLNSPDKRRITYSRTQHMPEDMRNKRGMALRRAY